MKGRKRDKRENEGKREKREKERKRSEVNLETGKEKEREVRDRKGK